MIFEQGTNNSKQNVIYSHKNRFKMYNKTSETFVVNMNYGACCVLLKYYFDLSIFKQNIKTWLENIKKFIISDNTIVYIDKCF